MNLTRAKQRAIKTRLKRLGHRPERIDAMRIETTADLRRELLTLHGVSEGLAQIVVHGVHGRETP